MMRRTASSGLLYSEFKDMQRGICIAVESLRNSADLISTHIAERVASRLSTRPCMGEDWANGKRSLWQSLVVEEEAAELLAEIVQLEWDGGRLWAKEGADDVIDTITATLMAVWRFVKHTTSRWLTIGTAVRGVVAGLLTGLADCTAWIKKEAGCSLWYLNGFQRMGQREKQFMVKAAMISRVAESAQLALMRDSRVARVYDILWKEIGQSMRWLMLIDSEVWAELGHVCGMSGPELASSCIAGGHTSFHFFWRRVLCPASQMPWKLCRCDIAANL